MASILDYLPITSLARRNARNADKEDLQNKILKEQLKEVQQGQQPLASDYPVVKQEDLNQGIPSQGYTQSDDPRQKFVDMVKNAQTQVPQSQPTQIGTYEPPEPSPNPVIEQANFQPTEAPDYQSATDLNAPALDLMRRRSGVPDLTMQEAQNKSMGDIQGEELKKQNIGLKDILWLKKDGTQTYQGDPAGTPYKIGNAPPAQQTGDTGNIDSLVDIYIKTGVAPPMGMGANSPLRQKFFKRFDERTKEMGLSPDQIVQARMGFTAEKGARTAASSSGAKLQNLKVDQANHLNTLLDQNTDPNTGEYTISPVNHKELSIGLANLLSPTGTISDQRVQDLNQKTYMENLKEMSIRLGLSNPNEDPATPQQIVQALASTIDRQGYLSAKLRGGYGQGIGNSYMPTQKSQGIPQPTKDLNQMKRDKNGAKLMQDAKGNQAYVYPDGTIEEVK